MRMSYAQQKGQMVMEFQAFQYGWSEFERRAAAGGEMLPLGLSLVGDVPQKDLPQVSAAIRGWNTALQFRNGKFDIGAWRAAG